MLALKAHGFWASVVDVRRPCGEVLQSHVFDRISKLHLQEGRLEVTAFFTVEYTIAGKLKGLLLEEYMCVTPSTGFNSNCQSFLGKVLISEFR